MSNESLYAGTVRSRLDGSSHLPDALNALNGAVGRIVRVYQHRGLDERSTVELLEDLIITVNDQTWTVGATTRRWYRKIEGHWAIDIPPEELDEEQAEKIKNTIRGVAAKLKQYASAQS